MGSPYYRFGGAHLGSNVVVVVAVRQPCSGAASLVSLRHRDHLTGGPGNELFRPIIRTEVKSTSK